MISFFFAIVPLAKSWYMRLNRNVGCSHIATLAQNLGLFLSCAPGVAMPPKAKRSLNELQLENLASGRAKQKQLRAARDLDAVGGRELVPARALLPRIAVGALDDVGIKAHLRYLMQDFGGTKGHVTVNRFLRSELSEGTCAASKEAVAAVHKLDPLAIQKGSSILAEFILQRDRSHLSRCEASVLCLALSWCSMCKS